MARALGQCRYALGHLQAGRQAPSRWVWARAPSALAVLLQSVRDRLLVLAWKVAALAWLADQDLPAEGRSVFRVARAEQVAACA